jgi:hypothetical protein
VVHFWALCVLIWSDSADYRHVVPFCKDMGCYICSDWSHLSEMCSVQIWGIDRVDSLSALEARLMGPFGLASIQPGKMTCARAQSAGIAVCMMSGCLRHRVRHKTRVTAVMVREREGDHMGGVWVH